LPLAVFDGELLLECMFNPISLSLHKCQALHVLFLDLDEAFEMLFGNVTDIARTQLK